jgi:transcriptional regulator with XRE-family HTH domain
VDKKSLRKLRKKLPTRILRELVARSGMSKSTVSKTMTGARESKVVIDAAIAWAEEIETENLSRKQKLDKLCSRPD